MHKLALRAALSPEERRNADRTMAGLLFSCPVWKDAEEIFCYASFRDEADTSRIIREALESGKRAAVPKVEGKRLMEFYYINGTEELTPGYRESRNRRETRKEKHFRERKPLW